MDHTTYKSSIAVAMEPPQTEDNAEELEVTLRAGLKSAVTEANTARGRVRIANGAVACLRMQLRDLSWQKMCKDFGATHPPLEKVTEPGPDEQTITEPEQSTGEAEARAGQPPSRTRASRPHSRTSLTKWGSRVKAKQRLRAPPGECKVCFAEGLGRRFNGRHTRTGKCRLTPSPPTPEIGARPAETADSV